ncbi:uncharacterized protein LOC130641218 [Hydractinia symbiolongicarpus]|uniref:uncharacterized protein LOC130641218 n=1 Tax=Hydractinia symbiolongicarpus TaxID=13093 RepID=UPI00254F91F1|nr:uncharacterized protein LOC130641218 [Hydractinia symbiolongicarpus]XP_057303915.1 uncharacterized protein LOC130641218 [Hydractinia symbiolongicarpus]
MVNVMESYLRRLSSTLHPSEEVIKHGKEVMNKMFRALQTSKMFKIDRCELVGGAEKKSSIYLKVDFDCVVIVNNIRPSQFEEVLDHFEDILLFKFDIKESEIKKTPRRKPKTLQFTLEDVDFDVVLAIAPGERKEGDAKMLLNTAKQTERNQDFEAAKELMKMQNGLSEMAVQFLKKQTPFVHEFIRLCKYWNNTLFFELVFNNVYVYGRSSIIELLAIDAGLKHHGNFSLSFKTFLETVKDIKNCEITFEDTYYRADQIPTSAKTRPYLIDPANPYHNFLEDVKEIHLQEFARFASDTLQRFLSNDLPGLFEPQPDWLGRPLKPKKWIVGIEDGVTIKTPSIDIKSLPSHLKNEKSIKSMKNYMAVLEKNMEMSANCNPVDPTYVQGKMQDAIDKLFSGGHQNWSSSSEAHSNRATTVTIPLVDGRNKAVRVSCDWE